MVRSGAPPPSPGHRALSAARPLRTGLLAAAFALLLAGLLLPGPVRADGPGRWIAYRCDGEPLSARVENGAVDAVAIPNMAGGTVPGAFVLLQWRGISLQLPRTNHAGAPSFSDGKWWWSLEDPQHPDFRLRRGDGDAQHFACTAVPA
jgi:hypothetical protein